MFGKLFFLVKFIILCTEKYLTVITGYYRLYNTSLYILECFVKKSSILDYYYYKKK